MKPRCCTALTAVLLAASPALAVDGVLEINQACAAGPGCFPGDFPGFPVTTGPGQSYRLTGSLAIPDPDTGAIELGDRSSLDLNGFEIAGPTQCLGLPALCFGTGSGTGIVMGAGSTVRDGIVRGFGGDGVKIKESGRVERLLIQSNGNDGINSSFPPVGTNAQVIDCRIARNGGDGIDLAFVDVRNPLIRGNQVFGNAGDGIRPGQQALVTGNSVWYNGGVGLRAQLGIDENAFGANVFHDNLGGNTEGGIPLGGNVCGTDTVCP